MRILPVSAALFLSVVLLSSGCYRNDIDEEMEESSNYQLLQMAMCPDLDGPVAVFEDMGNGTIRKQIVSTYNTITGIGCETRTSLIQEEYIMKCLYGQLYRPVENDCRGTGAAPLWGAVPLSFCDTADRSCDIETGLYNPYTYNYDNEWFADPLTSPAAGACAASVLDGREWKLPWGVSLYGEHGQVFPEGQAAFFPDLPPGISLWSIWANFSDPSTAAAYSFDTVTGLAFYTGFVDKTLPNYVLCVTWSDTYRTF